jgi:hypothetical protein
MMKFINTALQAIRNLLKLIPLCHEESTVEATAQRILNTAQVIIKTQCETIRMLDQSIQKREEDARMYPNLDYSFLVAKDFLQRSLQMRLGQPINITSWEYGLGEFSKYREDARGGKGYFELKIQAEICHSWFTPPAPQKTHLVYALLQIACETSEHFWVPNHCGSYFCVDGNDYFEVCRDWETGNIRIEEEGHGSHVPDSFRKEVAEFSKPLEVSAG